MNEPLLKPMEQKSIVDRIIARLTEAVASGRLKPGQKIPTETELADSMGVGRNSVREAIKALVTIGVLDIRRAEGTFVSDGFNDRMMEPMVYGLILEGGSTLAVLELRHIFEVGVLQLAIEKATGEDIARLKTALDYLEKTILKPSPDEAIMMADIAFHDALQRIAGNPLVEKISFVVERIARDSRKKALERFRDNGELGEMLELHRNLYEVVVNRDMARVVDTVNDHFRYWKDVFNQA
jgi:DNA-binding FadR family transcriptional regulator